MTNRREHFSLFGRKALAGTLAVCLAGCAGSKADYPSFDIPSAAAEDGRVSMYFEGVAAPEPAPIDSLIDPLPDDIDDQIAAITARAETAARAFTDDASPTRTLVRNAIGADVTSDQWAEAQLSLADLSSHHGEGLLALAELDMLVANASTNLASDETLKTISESQAKISAALAAQSATLSAFSAQLER